MGGILDNVGMAEPTVDDLPAEADALEARRIELEGIAAEDVREPHRHAYHELIWVREGSGSHLIDGERVDFGPRTLTLIAKGQVHQFERAEGAKGLVVRFDDDWLTGGLAEEAGHRGWLFTSHGCTALSAPEDEAERFDALLDLLCEEAQRPPDLDSAELRRHLLSSALLWAKRWREAQLEQAGASRGDVQLHQRFLETLERDFATHHDAGHYAAELGVTTGTLSRLLARLTGKTTKQLILERVVLEAMRLLRFSDLSVKEIASRLGFSDQFAFSKTFKRQRGEAPLEVRNRA
jgi:AraC family transcriptional regulator, transcriptional activator of pobA